MRYVYHSASRTPCIWLRRESDHEHHRKTPTSSAVSKRHAGQGRECLAPEHASRASASREASCSRAPGAVAPGFRLREPAPGEDAARRRGQTRVSFVAIRAGNGIVTIVAHRSEMGTGSTHQPCRWWVAEEMEADWTKVKGTASTWRRMLNFGNSGHPTASRSNPALSDCRCGRSALSARAMLEGRGPQNAGAVAVAEVKASNHGGGASGEGGTPHRLRAILPPMAAKTAGAGDRKPEAEKTRRTSARLPSRQGRRSASSISATITTWAAAAILAADVRLPGMKICRDIARPPVDRRQASSRFDANRCDEKSLQASRRLDRGQGPGRGPSKFQPLGGRVRRDRAANTGAAGSRAATR